MPDRELIDWHRLLTTIHVPWIDRGDNVGRNNINIACPFCRNDPSYHLSISLDGLGYYCWRNSAHGGRNLVRLLYALGIQRYSAIDLLNRYRSAYVPDQQADAPKPTKLTVRWDAFEPASTSQACLDYLASRGCPDPAKVCTDYDLRYAPVGRWAGRLIFPLSNQAGLAGWTGRSLTGRQPRYLTEQTDPVLYVPAPITADYAVLVEGPFDALKVSLAGFSAVGLLGLATNDARLVTLRYYLRHCRQAFVIWDRDVKQVSMHSTKLALAQALTGAYVNFLTLPPTADDPGEMVLPDLAAWLGSAVKNASGATVHR